MSAQWDDLPEEVRAELTREGYGPEAGPMGPDDREALELRIGELRKEALILTERMRAAMALPLDHRVFTGAEDTPPGLPQVAHGEVIATDGATPQPPTTREGARSLPEVPHSGEQPTPVQRRAFWDYLHADLVARAEAELKHVRGMLPYAVRPDVMTDYLAREWAALQLLKALRDMKAPEVPVDHTVDQPTLEEALEPTPTTEYPVAHGHRWPCPGYYTGNHDPLRVNLWACICTEAGT